MRRLTRTARKAITGGIAGAAAALGGCLADGNLTTGELLASLGAGLIAGAAVYVTPRNADA